MGADAWARTPTPASDTAAGRSSDGVRRLLRLGLVVGPLYLTVGLAQALMRDGFVLARHPLSVLANGPGGWVQTLNFVVSGLMVVAAAVGFAQALRPQSRAASWFLGAFGVSMLLAAIFRADPVDGFPPGTPPGMPTSMTTFGMLHFLVGGLGFLSLAVSCFVFAVAMSRRQDSVLLRLSLLAGLSVVGGFFAPMALPAVGPTAGIWFAVVIGWAWLAYASWRLGGR